MREHLARVGRDHADAVRERLVVLVGNLAHDLFQGVFDGDDPRHATELVGHDGHMCLATLEFQEQRPHAHRLGHEPRGTQQSANATGLGRGGDLARREAVGESGEHVSGVDDADDVVRGAIPDRQPCVGTLRGQADGLVPVGGEGNRDHLGAGCHDLRHANLVEPDDTPDHVAGRPLDAAFTVGLVNDQPQFVLWPFRHLIVAASAHGGTAERSRQTAKESHNRAQHADHGPPQPPRRHDDPRPRELRHQHRHHDEHEPDDRDPSGDR